MFDLLYRLVPAFLTGFLLTLTVGYVALALMGHAPFGPDLSLPDGRCYGPQGECFTRP